MGGAVQLNWAAQAQAPFAAKLIDTSEIRAI